MNKKEQLKFHEMQANWWMNAATNGHALNRKLYRGVDGPEFTDEEKIKDAMETSQRHMQLFMETAENWKGESTTPRLKI